MRDRQRQKGEMARKRLKEDRAFSSRSSEQNCLTFTSLCTFSFSGQKPVLLGEQKRKDVRIQGDTSMGCWKHFSDMLPGEKSRCRCSEMPPSVQEHAPALALRCRVSLSADTVTERACGCLGVEGVVPLCYGILLAI